MRVLLLVAVLFTGCLPAPDYQCTSDAQCSGGTCQLAFGFCSFMDSVCTSGQRFAESAGVYANQCVGDQPLGDAGMEGAMEGGMGCPATYMAITGGQGNHVYRRLSNSDQWNDHRDRCSNDGANAYMAIADDAGELMAITNMTTDARIWIGITDSATENTFLTTKGTPATFLPWDANQPNNSNNSDCVEAIRATQLVNDERCSQSREAICECEP